MVGCDVLVLEYFCGGSHAQFLEYLCQIIPDAHYLCLSDQKWHWKSRCGGIQILEKLRTIGPKIKMIFMTSVGNLAELVGICPNLGTAKKLLYFHENQLVYPHQNEKERDYQYGYNQIISCIAADKIFFNSHYNMLSFINKIPSFVNRIPGFKCPITLVDEIQAKSSVLYFPVNIPEKYLSRNLVDCPNRPLRIVWPHRWEHDKNPDEFFDVILQLVDEGFIFELSVLGKAYSDVPACFDEAYSRLFPKYIRHWGRIDSVEEYQEHISECDVVVSTALHEFYGVSMLEAFLCGCFPLCPSRLSYPEIYPKDCLYNTKVQLTKQLRQFCKHPSLSRKKWSKIKSEISLDKYTWEFLKTDYLEILTT